MLKAVIFDIKRFAIYDGPGIRTTIFFKGCTLDCAWCQNPESKIIHPQLFFNSKKCIGCNRCIDICPVDKVSSNSKERFDSSRDCRSGCERCYEECPSEAIYKVGREYRLDDILGIILKDIDFYKTSGGGVTLSGGEPMLHIDFLKALIEKLAARNIDVIIETAGNTKWDSFKKIIKYPVRYYYDVKLIDEKDHIKYTGHPNRQLLDNLVSLNKSGSNIIIRIPLIPEITDTEENLIGIIGFMKDNDMQEIPVEILPYNQLAETKFNKKGINCGSVGQYFKPCMKTQDKELLFKRKKLFTENNISVRILSLE